ncbi:RES family NAD+ phosphorylase [Dongshaea marina]|uniref:RES family NAD+ phosphorylase n=1 Tax=Dongshaea marina TaxID=2047966 RepID=UPI000D3E98AC|nr:RES family NAD+ phosphorylase [Dongshaea marina]
MILFRAQHKRYLDSWQDYEKGNSYKNGARWNLPGTPVLYMSSNVQNAMLELSNYAPSPKVANLMFCMGVFESPSLRLYEIRPEELPKGWEQYPALKATQEFGSEILEGKQYDGLIVPSCTMNDRLVRSPHNEVRRSTYANVVLNPTKKAVKDMTLLDSHSPLYSKRAFAQV